MAQVNKLLIIKILNLKLVILLEYQKYKNISDDGYTPNWSEDVFVVKKIKKTVPRTCYNDIIEKKKLLKNSTKKNYKKQIKKNLQLKK